MHASILIALLADGQYFVAMAPTKLLYIDDLLGDLAWDMFSGCALRRKYFLVLDSCW